MHRVAFGTVVRAAGEVVAKLASLALVVAIARELGQGGLGDYVFGLSIATVLFIFAGFGTDQIVTREVARNNERVHDLFGNAIALKALTVAGLLPVMAAVVAAAGYPGETVAALVLIGAAVAVEIVTNSVYAVLQAHQRQELVAATLIVQRTVTATAGILVLLAGGGLLDVAAVMVGGAVLGLGCALAFMYRRVARPRVSIRRERWIELARAGVPVGLAITLFAVLLRLDASLLGVIEDSAEVGAYGAAIQVVFATKFITYAFAAAMLPWLSRQPQGEGSALGRGYELGLKALVAALLPIATAIGLLAEPLVELIYGPGFGDAVLPLQILAATAVLYAVNGLTSTLMVSRSRPGEFAGAAGIVLVQNLVFNLALIPLLGAVGAAINAVLSGLLLVAITQRRAATLVGRISPTRVTLAPAVATALMAGVILAAGSELTVPAVAGGALAWLAGFVAVERLAFPEDFGLYAGMLRAARARLGSQPPRGPEPTTAGLD